MDSGCGIIASEIESENLTPGGTNTIKEINAEHKRIDRAKYLCAKRLYEVLEEVWEELC